MNDKNSVEFKYNYKIRKIIGMILVVGGLSEVVVCIQADKLNFMIFGGILVILFIHTLKPATEEEKDLKSLTIDEAGIRIGTAKGVKSIEWKNMKEIREYPNPKNAGTISVEMVSNSNEAMSFSYKNFNRISKIRKSLNHFCEINNVSITMNTRKKK